MEKSAKNKPLRGCENKTTGTPSATLAKGAVLADEATTALRIWRHSRLVALPDLEEELQDRILILRNHPDVCAMSHNQALISYAAHLD